MVTDTVMNIYTSSCVEKELETSVGYINAVDAAVMHFCILQLPLWNTVSFTLFKCFQKKLYAVIDMECLCFVIHLPWTHYMGILFAIQIVLLDKLIICLFHEFCKNDLQTYTLFVIYICYAVWLLIMTFRFTSLMMRDYQRIVS